MVSRVKGSIHISQTISFVQTASSNVPLVIKKNTQLCKMVKLSIILILTIICVNNGESAKILGVFPMPAGSHYILASKLMKGLAEAGHDITMITPYKLKDAPRNGTWRELVLDGLAENFKNSLKDVNLYESSKRNVIQKMTSSTSIMINWVNKTMYYPNVRQLLASDEKFDAVIMEEFFNDAHKIFPHHFKCPLILLSSVGPNPMVNHLVGNPSPLSYVPHFFMNGNFINGLSFFQRIQNILISIVDYFFRTYYSSPIQENILRQAFPDAPSIYELRQQVSIMLMNSHISCTEALPVVPNMVEVGGYHVDPPKPLPKDLHDFLDSATEGAIYFSMGSNLQGKDISEDKKRMLLEVFGKLKQKVLWKFEEELPDMPKNVLIKSWMPQQDILAHPNVKLFITHGGFLSTTETIYHGIPILAVPVFADQFANANKAVQFGYGLQIGYNSPQFTKEILSDTIRELLENPKYNQNAKHRSQLYHDRQIKPMDNLVYWVEYVIRHKGADHLKVKGVTIPWYKYYMVDVVVFLASSIWLLCSFVKYAYKQIFCKKPKHIVKQKIN